MIIIHIHGPKTYCFLSPYPIILGLQHPFLMPLSFFWDSPTSVLAEAMQHLLPSIPIVIGSPLHTACTAFQRLHQPSHCPSVQQKLCCHVCIYLGSSRTHNFAESRVEQSKEINLLYPLCTSVFI